MADSNITKRILAASLKHLMIDRSFQKINIHDICEKCGMNRKSFYYHFRDKYDLVNWIFDNEFVLPHKASMHKTEQESLEALCTYFYENRAFYRQAFKIQGQNSFSEHFCMYIYPYVEKRFSDLSDDQGTKEFRCRLIAESLRNALEYWLDEKEPLLPERFVACIK